MKDLYSILGIQRNATPHDIKSAFRQKAKELHPDVNNGMGDEAFKELAFAYSVLMDEAKKAEYDQSGFFDDTKLDINAMAQETVIMLFSHLVRNAKPQSLMMTNILSTIEQHIGKQSQELFNKLEDENTKIKVIYQVKNNIKKKQQDGLEDLFRVIVNEEVKECTRKIQEIRSQLSINRAAIQILQGYDYTTIIQMTMKDEAH